MKSRMIGTAVAFALAVVSALTVTADDVTLPAGYTKLDYIASTGTQYINTGLFPSDRLSITMDLGHFRLTNPDTTKPGSLFGTVSGANFYDAYVECINQGFGQKQLKFIGVAAGTVIDTAVDEWAANDVHLVLDGGDGTKDADNKYVGTMSISVNGGEPKVVSVQTSAATHPSYPFCVFARANCGWPGTFRLYGMKAVKADKSVLFELVPCISPDGEIGVYDLAGKRFLGNSGTGTFLTPSDAAHDLVKNGGLDIGTVQAQGWSYRNELQGSCPNWTFEGLYTGLTRPATTWVYWNRPIGKYAAFMQQASSDMVISQKFSVTRPGDYVLSFDYASRPNYTAKPSHVELYDAAGGLVGNISTEVVGDAVLTTTTVAYPNVAAGEYTVKLIHNGVSGDGGCVFDNVSFRPSTSFVDESDKLVVYDGDLTLDAGLLADKDLVLKNGEGALVAPASCSALPAVRVRKGTLDAQDGAATAYTVDGALVLEAGTMLKLDAVGNAVDSFGADSVAINGLVTIEVGGKLSGVKAGVDLVLLTGTGLAAADLDKITLNTDLPIRLELDSDGNLVAKVLLPSGYTKLDYIESTGTQYLATGCELVSDTSISMDFGGLYKVTSGNHILFGSRFAAGGYMLELETDWIKFYGADATAPVISKANLVDWFDGRVRLEIDGESHTLSYALNGATPTVKSVDTTFSASGIKFSVFTLGSDARRASYRLYGIKAKKPNGTALFELIPCIRADGEIGAYDLVNERFLPNSGTGRFLTPSDHDHDLVRNGGFDTGSLGNGDDTGRGDNSTWAYSSKTGFVCPDWSFLGGGLTKPGSIFASAALTMDRFAAFVQNARDADRNVSQEIQVKHSGDYVLSYDHAYRANVGEKKLKSALYDAAGKLVGEEKTVVSLGGGSWTTETVTYPNLQAGSYTLKFIKPAGATDETTVIDHVSFKSVDSYVEAGSGLYLADGDFILENTVLADKDALVKNGTGNLKAPAACANLPTTSLYKGVLDTQDDAATAYTVDGTLRIDGGATLKVDLVNGVCDSFAVTALDVSAASKSNRIFIDIPASVGNERVSGSHLLVSGAGLSESDAAKFKTVGMKGSFSVKNGDLYLDPPKGLFIVVQ